MMFEGRIGILVRLMIFIAAGLTIFAGCAPQMAVEKSPDSRPRAPTYTGAVTHQGRAYTNVLTDEEFAEQVAQPRDSASEIKVTVGRLFRVRGLKSTSELFPGPAQLLEQAEIQAPLRPSDFQVRMETHLQFPGASVVRLYFLSEGQPTFELAGDALETDGRCVPFQSNGLSYRQHSVCMMGNDLSGRLIFRVQMGLAKESFWLEVLPDKSSQSFLAEPLGSRSQIVVQIPQARHELLNFLEMDLGRAEVQRWIQELWPKDRRIPRFLKLYHESAAKKPLGEALLMSRMMAEIRASEFPDALAFVPFAESNFKSNVTSPAGAHGFWQFMPATALNYGLKIPTAENPSQRDQREDIVLSTRAAIRKYREMASDFSWGSDFKMLMAAYNMGQWGLDKKVKQLDGKSSAVPTPGEWAEFLTLQEATEYSSDFWELHDARMIPNETRKYVTKIVAALVMALDPKLSEEQGYSPISAE